MSSHINLSGDKRFKKNFLGSSHSLCAAKMLKEKKRKRRES